MNLNIIGNLLGNGGGGGMSPTDNFLDIYNSVTELIIEQAYIYNSATGLTIERAQIYSI